MLEQDNIQQRGFKNVSEGGNIVGFQVPFRTSYYRGVWLPQIQSLFTITVDGEVFPAEHIQFSFGGNTYEQKDFQSLSEVYWNKYEVAYLIVRKPGGLAPGVHDVSLTYGYTVCYNGTYGAEPNTFERTMVLCI